MRKPQKMVIMVILGLGSSQAQVGDLLWGEEFEDLDDWHIEVGNGSWGWGNGELEYYQSNNVEIFELVDDPGNSVLRLTARQESGPDIVDQWGNPLSYTSGRVHTRARVAVQYGLVETRVRVPDLDLGGWPAVWLMGCTNYGWPFKGELDLMEMGAGQAFRDLHDTHNGGNGLDNSTVNEMVGANAIFFSPGAVGPDNPLGAASLAWDPDDDFFRPYYNYDPGLSQRFLIYRMYWDADSIRFTVIDDGIEYDLYTNPFPIAEGVPEFHRPFYFLANLAIGGTYTDVYNLGDPGSGEPVTMPLPAEMDVDYIRVYEWNGQGEIRIGPPEAQVGTVGIFTDETATDSSLVPGTSSEIHVWEGTLNMGTIPPLEGDNVLAFQTTGLGWFGAGIMSIQPLNLSGFGDGHLNFSIRIPANVSFQIGITDAWSNQSWVEFPAHVTTHGLERNGEWGQASIPVSEIRGELIDLRMLFYPFAILEVSGAQCEFALDDIYWSGGTTALESRSEGQPETISLLSSFPNPFNPMTTIRYQLAADNVVRLSVIDLTGKRVRTLVNEYQTTGTYSLQWDGRNDAGERAGTGVFLVRLDNGSLIETIKVIHLK